MNKRRKTQVERSTLSDGSVVYNVLCRDENAAPVVRFGCVSKMEADDLAEHIEHTSWIETLGEGSES